MSDRRHDWAATGLAPLQVIRIWGMRRSGNHAIINWLMRNAPEPGALFFNNCKPNAHPTETARAVELNGKRVHPERDGGLKAVCAPLGDGAALLFSFEDRVPQFGIGKPQLRACIADAAVDREIIIYRSFLNWCASLLKKIAANPRFSRADRMGIMAKAIGTYFRMLEVIESGAALAIHYDAWIAGAGYRAERIGALGWALRDNGLGKQQRAGGGSSFDDAAPDVAKLASRWRQMAADEEFRSCLWMVAGEARHMTMLAAHFPEDAAALSELSWKGERR